MMWMKIECSEAGQENVNSSASSTVGALRMRDASAVNSSLVLFRKVLESGSSGKSECNYIRNATSTRRETFANGDGIFGR